MLTSKRLILRQWQEEDFEPFARLNADPRVMECFPKLLSREESDRQAKAFSDDIENNGWGLWAAEMKEGGAFIGMIGLRQIPSDYPCAPGVEVGWRLAHEFWGKGYATEGALASLRYGFDILRLEEILSFTVPVNVRSRQVMERIGMQRDLKRDFDHPRIEAGNLLRRHVLYRIGRMDWRENETHR